MANIKYINTMSEFNEFINGDGLRVVKLSAQWCSPCRMQSAVITGLEERENVSFATVDIDELEALARFMKIMSIPVLAYFKNGKEIDRTVGLLHTPELINKINSLL